MPSDDSYYHYVKKNGKWYFDSDSEFKFPIVETIEQEFVHEFAHWVTSTEVSGKISVVPFPAGLGHVDRRLEGFPKTRITDFVRTFEEEISQKFDIGPEMLTHTRALNIKSGKLISGISEHDWSQKQDEATLTEYLSLALRILKSAGLKSSGVTSPCNFGMHVEREYVKAILNAGTSVLGQKVLWYFLQVDSQSQNVDHRVMYLNREAGEAVVSIVGSMSDPLLSAQFTDLPFDDWVKEKIDPILSMDGKSGRIADQITGGSYVTIVTHWQSLYSNGTRYGLKGLDELLSRINGHLRDGVVWMRCSEIAQYLACTSSAVLRCRTSIETQNDESIVDLSSSFDCKNFTFSFESDSVPTEISLNFNGEEVRIGDHQMPKVLERVPVIEQLNPNSWCATHQGSSTRIVICISELFERQNEHLTEGVSKKMKRKPAMAEYTSSLLVRW